jgi:hypothetical protein
MFRLSPSLFFRAALCRILSAPWRQKSVFIGVHPWLKKKAEIAKRTQFLQVSAIQAETKKKFPTL